MQSIHDGPEVKEAVATSDSRPQGAFIFEHELPEAGPPAVGMASMSAAFENGMRNVQFKFALARFAFANDETSADGKIDLLAEAIASGIESSETHAIGVAGQNHVAMKQQVSQFVKCDIGLAS